MRSIESFKALMDEIDSLADGWVYLDGTLDKLEQARFMVSQGREDVDLEQVRLGTEAIPAVVHERGMRRLLDVATAQDAVALRREAMPDATLEQYAEAIRHYVTEDDFID